MKYKNNKTYFQPIGLAEANVAEVLVKGLEVGHIVEHGVGQGALLPSVKAA